MAQHDRMLLNKHDIERFKAWLNDNRQTWREGKGDYQLLQVKIGKGWGAICTDAKSVITTPPALRAMIQHFQAGKPYPVKAAAKPAEDQQYLNDLRDDFAMAALPSFLELCPTEVWNQGQWPAGKIDHAELVAKSAYCVADAMLAERAKRLGGAA